MNNLIEDQIGMRELREAAYHEAGHLILLRRFGGVGAAAVWENLGGNPDEKPWRGQCVTYICPPLKREQAKHLGLRAIPYLPKDWCVQWAAAGLIAEEILDGINDPRWAAERVHARIDMEDASATDLQYMGIPDIYNYDMASLDRSVKKAYRYLVKDWPLVQREAERLIEEARQALRQIVSSTTRNGFYRKHLEFSTRIFNAIWAISVVPIAFISSFNVLDVGTPIKGVSFLGIHHVRSNLAECRRVLKQIYYHGDDFIFH